MTPEEKSLLERTYKMAEENNSMLRSIKRTNRIGTIFRIIYWVVLIGAALGVYYYLQPYLEGVSDIIIEAQNVIFGE